MDFHQIFGIVRRHYHLDLYPQQIPIKYHRFVVYDELNCLHLFVCFIRNQDIARLIISMVKQNQLEKETFVKLPDRYYFVPQRVVVSNFSRERIVTEYGRVVV